MINLLSAATSTPQHAFQTTELTNALMHKLSPELINTLNSLGVDQRYSVMDNYPRLPGGQSDECDQFDDRAWRQRHQAMHRGMAGRPFANWFADCRHQYS